MDFPDDALRAPICDIYDKELVQRLIVEAKPLVKIPCVFCCAFDPEPLRLPQLEEEYASWALPATTAVTSLTSSSRATT